MRELRAACATVARRAAYVRIEHDAIPAYAALLPLNFSSTADPEPPVTGGAEEVAAFWLTLDAINYGSGWFPTLRKPQGRSGYGTVASGVRERFAQHGPWTAAELSAIEPEMIAQGFGQDRAHPLMALFADSLRDLGRHLTREFDGSFAALAGSGGDSAEALARSLGRLGCFADSSRYDELDLPFLKRAQIAAADLARAGVTRPRDLASLTMFADNLVPHVLKLDGILRLDLGLERRIEREQLIEHGSREEVEIRACAVHAVELVVAARRGVCAADVDQLLWRRGQQPRYKVRPRHRSRCTAY
jgi:hypothetical protein